MEHEIEVKVTQSRYLQSPYIEEKHYARFDGCRPYSLGDIERRRKMCKRQWSAKYRSRTPGQDTCVESVHVGEALCKVWWLEV